MKQYIDAELKIVSMQNDIIATSVTKNDTPISGNEVGGPARRSIWD